MSRFILSLAIVLLLTACSGGGGSGEPPNNAPVAQAGSDQTVDEQATVTLNGAGSTDSDGTIQSYQWTQIATGQTPGGTLVTLSNADTVSATFTTPSLSAQEILRFQLTVTDNDNASSTATVTVTVNPVVGLNDAPTSDPGPPQSVVDQTAVNNVIEQTVVSLDGSTSSDPDGSIQDYQWQQASGPLVTLIGANTVTPSFTAPDVVASADLEFELTVTDNEGASVSATVTITVQHAAITAVSGQITFDLVPVTTTGPVQLDYNATQASPVRGVTVQLIEVLSGVNVLGTAVTDANGDYTIVGPTNTQVFLRVRAEMVRAGAPSWDFRVVDNTNTSALYVVDSLPFDTGIMNTGQNFRAASGWTGASYGNPRAAAPFAILDTIYDAVQFVLTADPTLSFPPFVAGWSPNNNTSLGADGNPNPRTGDIGSAFFAPGFGGNCRRIPVVCENTLSGIFLLGREDENTDEFDRGVILREWVHYIQNAFSRDDNIFVGGPHDVGDQLDMRVAFAEGLARGVAGMILTDGVLRDTFGIRQEMGFSINVEGSNGPNPGWYSEESIQEIVYDLFDSDVDSPEDTLSLGFGPIYRVLTNQVRTSVAITSIFPFIDALKGDLPGSAAVIDELVSAQSIAVITDEYGSNRVNSGNPPNGDVLPIYANLTVNGGPVNVCSTDDFSSSTTGSTNKLGSRRLLRFTVDAAGLHTVSATTTVAPAGERADPAMFQRGPFGLIQNEPDVSCTPLALENCTEVASVTLSAGDYVLEVYENTNANDDPALPPIGRTCFDVEITQ